MIFNRIILLLFVLVTGLSAAYYLTGHLDRAVDPVGLLPVDTVAFVDIGTPGDTFKKFRHSKLGSQIYSIKWPEVLHALDVPEDMAGDFLSASVTLREILGSRLFHELSGRRTLLALLPLPDFSGRQGGGADLTESLVLISRPNHRAALVDQFFSSFTGDYEYVTEFYLGKEIRTFALNNEIRVSLVASDGFFITAFSVAVVKQCLDQSLKNLTQGISGLHENTDFSSVRRRLRSGEDQFFYLDLPGLRDLLHQSPITMPEVGSFAPVSALNRWPVQTMALFRQSGDRILKYTGILRFDQESSRRRQGMLLYPPPTVNTFLNEVPADLIAFYWTNMSDFGAFVRGLRSDEGSVIARMVQDFEKWLRLKTEISLDDFLAMFGPGFSVNVSEVWTDGFLPMPKICFRLEVHERDAVLAVLQKMTAGQRVNISRIGTVDVHSVQLAGGLIQPSYALKDGFLIIADSRQQMQVILADQQRKLVADPLFKSVDVGLAEPANMIGFIRNAELVHALQETAAWTGALLVLNDPQRRGVRAGILIKRVVVPVLEGLKMYLASGFRMVSSESELVFESALVRDDT